MIASIERRLEDRILTIIRGDSEILKLQAEFRTYYDQRDQRAEMAIVARASELTNLNLGEDGGGPWYSVKIAVMAGGVVETDAQGVAVHNAAQRINDILNELSDDPTTLNTTQIGVDWIEQADGEDLYEAGLIGKAHAIRAYIHAD